MEFMFDTANLEEIRKYAAVYPFTGVTSNPSILKREGRLDFFAHFREIQNLIGKGRSLFLQTVATDCATMVAEAERLAANLKGVVVKIPATSEGIKAIGILKKKGFPVTATAIFTELQGLLSLAAGADFLAPYYSRIEAAGGNPVAMISSLRNTIARQNLSAELIAASFHRAEQVEKAVAAGADIVTLSPTLLDAIDSEQTLRTVEEFARNWEISQECENVTEVI